MYLSLNRLAAIKVATWLFELSFVLGPMPFPAPIAQRAFDGAWNINQEQPTSLQDQKVVGSAVSRTNRLFRHPALPVAEDRDQILRLKDFPDE